MKMPRFVERGIFIIITVHSSAIGVMKREGSMIFLSTEQNAPQNGTGRFYPL